MRLLEVPLQHMPLRACGVILLALLLLACSGDCFFAGSAKAWVDRDEDGVWDPGESSLPDVQFFVDDVRNQSTNVGDEAISNHEGEALVYVWLPGCPSADFEIYAKPPSGYRPTTEPRISAHQTEEGPFLFGFAPASE